MKSTAKDHTTLPHSHNGTFPPPTTLNRPFPPYPLPRSTPKYSILDKSKLLFIDLRGSGFRDRLDRSAGVDRATFKYEVKLVQFMQPVCETWNLQTKPSGLSMVAKMGLTACVVNPARTIGRGTGPVLPPNVAGPCCAVSKVPPKGP